MLSNEPFAQSRSKQQTNLYGQCVRQMLQEFRQDSRFVAKKLDTRRVSQARQAPGPRGQRDLINSVQTRCIVKGEAQKSPLFWRFSGAF